MQTIFFFCHVIDIKKISFFFPVEDRESKSTLSVLLELAKEEGM